MLHAPAPAASEIALASDIRLVRARAHEATGPSRHVLAMLAAQAVDGPVLWLQFSRERLLAEGIRDWIEPRRLLIGRVRRPEDGLWSAEEALRAGIVPLVVVDLPEPPTLAAVRRLHLAAEAGALAQPVPPLALLLTASPGGAAGIETRWHLEPAPSWAGEDGLGWRVKRVRARTLPERTWIIRLAGDARVRAALA